MLKNELRLRERAYRNGWLRERKLHMIWRAIARRHLSRVTPYLGPTGGHIILDLDNDLDGESDP